MEVVSAPEPAKVPTEDKDNVAREVETVRDSSRDLTCSYRKAVMEASRRNGHSFLIDRVLMCVYIKYLCFPPYLFIK